MINQSHVAKRVFNEYCKTIGYSTTAYTSATDILTDNFDQWLQGVPARYDIDVRVNKDRIMVLNMISVFLHLTPFDESNADPEKVFGFFEGITHMFNPQTSYEKWKEEFTHHTNHTNCDYYNRRGEREPCYGQVQRLEERTKDGRPFCRFLCAGHILTPRIGVYMYEYLYTREVS